MNRVDKTWAFKTTSGLLIDQEQVTCGNTGTGRGAMVALLLGEVGCTDRGWI